MTTLFMETVRCKRQTQIQMLRREDGEVSLELSGDLAFVSDQDEESTLGPHGAIRILMDFDDNLPGLVNAGVELMANARLSEALETLEADDGPPLVLAGGWVTAEEDGILVSVKDESNGGIGDLFLEGVPIEGHWLGREDEYFSVDGAGLPIRKGQRVGWREDEQSGVSLQIQPFVRARPVAGIGTGAAA